MVDHETTFQDRTDAGKKLAERLMAYRDDNPVILALPRGGVVVGYEVAKALAAPLDAIVARKIGAPFQPELGIGAVAPDGVLLVDERAIRYLGISQEDIDRLAERERAEVNRRLQLYRGDSPPSAIEDRTVILVDDGLATGVTARAALLSIRRHHPRKVVLAVPVCAAETAAAFRSLVDDFVCVHTPREFHAVGLWYQDFQQTSDEEVIYLLQNAREWQKPLNFLIGIEEVKRPG